MTNNKIRSSDSGSGRQCPKGFSGNMPPAIRRILFSCFFLLLCCGIHGNAQAKDSVSSLQNTVRVGYFKLNGFHNIQQNGKKFGYGYELLQKIAMHTGWNYEYVGYEKTWKELLEMLDKGEIDLLMPAIRTEERLKKYAYSINPIGYSNTVLSIRLGDQRFQPGDYANWPNIRVGLLEHSPHTEAFKRFADKQKIQYTPVYFQSIDGLKNALLKEKNIDAIAMTQMRQFQGEQIYATFAPRPFYAIMSKKESHLFRQLNAALEEIGTYRPNFHIDLANKYFTLSSVQMPQLNVKEQEFIRQSRKNKQVFYALINPDRFPLSGYQNGEIQGFLVDLIRLLQQKTGLNIQILPIETRKEYWVAKHRPDIAMILDAHNDYANAETLHYTLTEPYYHTTFSRIRRKDLSHRPESLAILRAPNIWQDLYSRFGKNMKLVSYDTVEEVVQAVRARKQDAAYLFSPIAEQAVGDDATNQLTTDLLFDLKHGFSIAVKQSQDPRLAAILNKAVSNLHRNEVDHLLADYTYRRQKEKTSLFSYLSTHPWIALGVPLGLVFLICTLLAYLLFTKRKAYQEAQIIRKLPFHYAVIDRNGNFLSRSMSAPFIKTIAPKLKNLLQLSEIPDYGTFRDAIRQAFETNQDLRIDFDFRGRKRSAEVLHLPYELFHRDTVLWLSQDTTELQTAKEEAKINEARLKQILQTIGDGIIVTDHQGTITLMNPAAGTLLNCPSDTMLQIPLAEIFHCSDSISGDPVETPIHQLLNSGKDELPFQELELLCPDGTRKQLAGNTTKLRNTSGEITGAVLVFRDVTQEYHQRRLQNENSMILEKAAAMAGLSYCKCNQQGEYLSTFGKKGFWPHLDGKPMDYKQYIIPEDQRPFLQAWENFLAHKQDELDLTYRSDSFGERRHYHMRSARFRPEPWQKDSDGDILCIIQEITEARRNEARYKETTQLFQTILDNLPCAVFVKDIDNQHRYLLANQFFHQLHELQPGTMTGKTDYDLYSKEDAEKYMQEDRDLAAGNTLLEQTEPVFLPDHRVFYSHTFKKVIRLLESGHRLVVGVCMDITNAREQEERLKQFAAQEQLLNQCLHVMLFENNHEDAISKILQAVGSYADADRSYLFDYNPQKHVLFCRAEWNRQTIDSRLEAIRNLPIPILPEWWEQLQQHHPVVQPNAEQALNTPQYDKISFLNITDVKSAAVYGIWSGNRLCGICGVDYLRHHAEIGESVQTTLQKIANLIGLSLDRKRIQEQLRASQQEQSMILNTLEIPILLFDKELRLLHVNAAACAMIGKTEKEILDSGDEFNLNTTTAKLMRLAYCDNQKKQQEIKHQGRTYLLQIEPILDGGGKLYRMLCSYIDITLQNQQRQQLKKALTEAQSANRAKSLFIANVSHEIRTPLNSVIGFAELLRREEVSPDLRKEYLDAIATSGNTLLELINDVLDLSKLESNKMEFRPIRTDLARLCREAINTFQHRAKEKNLRLTLDLQTFPDLWIDKLRIRQILFNLIGNAVKFTEKGEVELQVRFLPETPSSGTLRLRVRDTGIGISEKDRHLLTQPFYQAVSERGTSRGNTGTGLGLSITRRMVEKMNGTLELQSELGKGSIFTITLQRIQYEKASAPHAPERKENVSGQNGSFKNASILLLDDVPLNLKVLKAILNAEGITRVETISSPKEALTWLQKQHFDIFMTDLWMPEITGDVLAKQIRAMVPETLLVAVTADTDSENNFDMTAFDAILNKPISQEKIAVLFRKLGL